MTLSRTLDWFSHNYWRKSTRMNFSQIFECQRLVLHRKIFRKLSRRLFLNNVEILFNIEDEGEDISKTRSCPFFFRLEIIMWESNDVTTTLRGYVSKNVFLPTAAKQAAVCCEQTIKLPRAMPKIFLVWLLEGFVFRMFVYLYNKRFFFVFRGIKVISDFLKFFRLFYYYSQSNSFVSKVSLKKKDFTRYITLS